MASPSLTFTGHLLSRSCCANTNSSSTSFRTVRAPCVCSRKVEAVRTVPRSHFSNQGMAACEQKSNIQLAFRSKPGAWHTVNSVAILLGKEAFFVRLLFGNARRLKPKPNICLC
jgi:hypothetical protein